MTLKEAESVYLTLGFSSFRSSEVSIAQELGFDDCHCFQSSLVLLYKADNHIHLPRQPYSDRD